MRIGIFAKTFAGTDPVTVMTAAKAAGYDAVQYNLACSGLEPTPLRIADTAAQAAGESARLTGVAIAALSGTVNLIHPDPATRADGLLRLAEVIRSAPLMGAPIVTLCTGTRDLDDPWRHHPGNRDPSAWADLLAALGPLCERAERTGIRLGIEPEAGNVVHDAPAARLLLDQLASPALGIVLDPANLFEQPGGHGDIIARAADLLGDRIIMAHAKDRGPDGTVVAAGQGLVDFPRFIADLRGAGFDGDLVTHGLSASEAPGVATYLRGL